MKKILFFLFFLNSIAHAQIVNIPVVNFKNKLIALGIDINTDGNIQQSEALAVTSLSVANSNITDLTGINAFQNIIILNCTYNSLTSLNVNIPGLLVLLCQNNLLSSLNFSGCTNLSNFDASYNQLTSLDFSNNHNIMGISAESNLLTSINLVGCIQLYWLYLSSNNLNSINLAGLNNLNELIAPFNQITSLNVASISTLANLNLSYNQLSTLNTSGLANLTELMVQNNPNLTLLNVSNCQLLNYINTNNSGISTINTTGCNSLFQLSMQNNNLVSVSFNNLPSLNILGLESNNISDINIVNCPTLHLINLAYNNLQTLNTSACLSLNNLQINNNPNLTSLFIKNGLNETLYINNTSLQYICADETQVSSIQTQAGPNVVVSSYCTFTPGGNFNVINGLMLFDANNNGCSSSDIPQPNIKININDGTIQGTSFTNSLGNYSFLTQVGSFVMTPIIENQSWFNFSPASAAITFPNNNNNVYNQNFCITANGVHPDLEIVIAPIVPAQPGFDALYEIVYKNKGNQTLTGNLNFNYNDSVLDFVSSTIIPDSQVTGNLSWNYSNLLPFESRSINVVLNVNSPTETPAVNIGDTLSFSSNINPVSGDENQLDNSFTMNQVVVGSYDPNDKTCLEGTTISPTKIGDYLHYNVNFENTGTAAATFIVVKDEIDATKFDINSLQVMNSSHAMYTRISGNKVEFIFENINLGPNQYGNVVFKIKTKNTLVTGNTVTNIANIYFDYNFPITTNTASTTFQTLSNTVHTLDNSISVFPNPTSSFLTINSEFIIKSIELFDVQGRVLKYNSHNDTSMILDISDKSNGIYFVKITSDKGSKVQKIIKE